MGGQGALVVSQIRFGNGVAAHIFCKKAHGFVTMNGFEQFVEIPGYDKARGLGDIDDSGCGVDNDCVFRKIATCAGFYRAEVNRGRAFCEVLVCSEYAFERNDGNGAIRADPAFYHRERICRHVGGKKRRSGKKQTGSFHGVREAEAQCTSDMGVATS